MECDGATYHSSATARDRDKIREQVLNGLGWKILRVWSTDWWFDPEGCAQRLHESLEELLRKSRERRTEEEAFVDVHWEIGHQIEGIEEIRDADSPEVADVTPSAPLEEVERLSELVTSAASASTVDTPRLAAPVKAEKREYRIVDLSTFQADPDRFFDFDYRGTLASMIEAVMDAEGPLRIDVLAQRIARAHGWLRTGGRIRERVGLYLRSYDTTTESSGVFVWKKGQVVDVLPYRPPADETSRRAISEIPLAELASIIIENPDLLDMADPPRDMARLLGVERLAATARVRLEEAIEHARRLMAGEPRRVCRRLIWFSYAAMASVSRAA